MFDLATVLQVDLNQVKVQRVLHILKQVVSLGSPLRTRFQALGLNDSFYSLFNFVSGVL